MQYKVYNLISRFFSSNGNEGSQLPPLPTVMPVDRQQWRKDLNFSNFVNTAYEFSDLQKCGDSISSILVIGPGQGLDLVVLKWRGYQVTTFDIDETFSPDYLGSVHDLSQFKDKQFDVVIVSHVLEHLAVAYLDASLKEIARVSKYALIYLPVAGKHFQFRLKLGVRGIDICWFIDVFNWFEKPDGITARYTQGQHFWEIGMRGFWVSNVLKRMAPFFDVVSVYRNRDWNPSHNFVLKSR